MRSVGHAGLLAVAIVALFGSVLAGCSGSADVDGSASNGRKSAEANDKDAKGSKSTKTADATATTESSDSAQSPASTPETSVAPVTTDNNRRGDKKQSGQTEQADQQQPASQARTTENVFKWNAGPIPETVRARMNGVTMRPGCPVGFDDLAYVTVSHWDFNDKVVQGEIVVAASEADALESVFRQLFDARFPIRKMVLIDQYGLEKDPRHGADDFASIEDDNTSAFNCRLLTGSNTKFSEHAYGTALDLNPLENPYVGSSGGTPHVASRPFLDRSNISKGVIAADSIAVRAFASAGWSWGGKWKSPIDYQHFSRSGR